MITWTIQRANPSGCKLATTVIPDLIRNPVVEDSYGFRIKSGMTKAKVWCHVVVWLIWLLRLLR